MIGVNECIQEFGVDVIENEDTFFEQYAKSKLLDAIKYTLNTGFKKVLFFGTGLQEFIVK